VGGNRRPIGPGQASGRSPAGEPDGRDLLWFLAEGTAGTVGEEFFQRLVQHLALALHADVAFVAELVLEDPGRARYLACWEGGRLAEPVDYCLAGTPCAELGDSELVWHADGVLERFPDDEMVAELGLDSYLAVALRGSDGTHLGHLGVLAVRRLDPEGEQFAALRIFAARAAAEIERRRQERALWEREGSHRALAEEQAALRRVATLVAVEAPQRELLASVAGEVGLLLGADVASLVRWDGRCCEIVAGWSRSPDRAPPVGLIFDPDGAVATREALRTGRPARADEGELPREDTQVHRLGIRSAVAAPITVGRRRWGVVRAGRTGEEPLPGGSERRLGDFAELVAQAIANGEAREQLAASRARIVQAGDEARRRIERNLHDGAQQRLVSLALSVRLAEHKVGEDSDARPVLAQVADELAATLDELRELAHGIHPAVLTSHGLAAALQTLAGRAPLPVELAAVPDERLPESIEATAYYVVAESLTNVAKYARAGGATVSVARAGERLEVRVSDDGIGGADIDRGSGLRGLADRVEAVRGNLQVDSAPGRGTVVLASIPIDGVSAAT
jgi:signal transduction histidine kinase